MDSMATVAGNPRVRADGRLRQFFSPQRRALWTKAVTHGLCVAAPVLVSLVTLVTAIRGHSLAVDFDHGPWVAGGRVLAGATPYVGPHSPEVLAGSAFVYPALMAVLSVPFSLLPRLFADGLFTLLCMLAVIGTLRLCRVRDWRVYGIAFLWPAVTSGWQTANITLLIGLGLAAAWRWRDRPLVAGMLVALMISAKVFVWPLALWLLATRRYRAFACSVAATVALSAAGWSTVGFGQITRYLRLMSAVTRVQEAHAYSILALLSPAGHAVAYLAMVAVAAAVLVAAIVSGRRGHDLSAFALAVAACLLATPLVWLHYFALLIVPLAIARPRFAPIWVLPVLMWFPPTSPVTWQIAVTLLISAVVVAATLRATLFVPIRFERSPWRSHAHASGPA
jgi:hypothetical protein